MIYFFNKSSNKKRKKIYQFKYEDTTWHNEFHGYLNPSQDYSIISLKRLEEHGLDVNKYRFDKITSRNHLSRNKFENIAGVIVLTILFENTASGLNNIRINGSSRTPAVNNNKVEKRICNVLVLKESQVEFRLGNDFISDTNAIIELKPRSNYNKGKCTHQLKFNRDGVIVDLERVENVHDIYDEEEEDVSSDGEDFQDDENDDYFDGNNIAPVKHSKNKFSKYKYFKNFLKNLNNRVGFWNLVIAISLLFMIFAISYSSYKETQSLVEELVVPPYNNQITKPSIDIKLEDYVRKLKATASFLELFGLDKRQIPKASKASKAPKASSKASSKTSSKSPRSSSKTPKSSSSSSSYSASSSSSASSTSTTISSSSQQRVGEDEEELYTNLVKFAVSLDNTKRTLLDMYNQEVIYSFIFQQNVENLSKYLSLKKRRNILRMIPIIGRDEYFPLTKDFKGLVNNVDNVVNNTLTVMDEMATVQIYCERIINQVGKLKNELELFIVNGKSLTAWLAAFIMKFKRVVNNLGEIDSDTGLKCQKLLTTLDNDSRELLSLFKNLRFNLSYHLSDLFEFSEHFKITDRITDLEIDIIKKHLVKLQNNRRIIFDEVDILKKEEDDDICLAPSPYSPFSVQVVS